MSPKLDAAESKSQLQRRYVFVLALVGAVEILPRDALAKGDGRAVVPSGFDDDGAVDDVAQVLGEPFVEVVHKKLFRPEVLG